MNVKKKPTSFYLSDELQTLLKRASATYGISASQIVEEILMKEMKKREKKDEFIEVKKFRA